jgi:GntR family transcriptional regulator/MocR family aminotransferase
MLAIAVERDHPRPVYRQIEDQIRTAVRDGRLGPGDRLPSVRDLSAQLGVSRITVVNAYDNLVAAGYLTARVGSGTRVAPRDLDDGPMRRPPQLKVLRGQISRLSREPSSRIDFRPLGLSFDLFPSELWGQLLGRAWREVAEEPRPSAPADWGDPYLRHALAQHIGVTRGVKADPDSVLILSSATSICSVIARSFLGPSALAVVEDPGCPYFNRAISSTGAQLFGVRGGPTGMSIERLPARADLLLIGPSWAYPLGGTLPMPRRRELIAWANRTNSLVVEHDWAGSVRFEGGPLPAVETLDTAGRVLFVGSFFETMPAATIGYAIVPRRLRTRIAEARTPLDAAPSLVEQRALAHFIADGHLDAHLRRLRLSLASRRERLDRLARQHLKDFAVLRLGPAGMQAILSLEDRTEATDLARRAHERGLEVSTLSDFSLSEPDEQALVLDYSFGREEDLDVGVGLLRQAWQSAASDRVKKTIA